MRHEGDWGGQVYPVDIFFEDLPKESKVFDSKTFERFEHHFDKTCSKLVDILLPDYLSVHYLRVLADARPTQICFLSKATVVNVCHGQEFGTLVRVTYDNRLYTIWIPSQGGGNFFFDETHRFSTPSDSTVVSEWEFCPNVQLRVRHHGRAGETLVLPFVIMKDSSGKFLEEIKNLDSIERGFYRKSDWFFAKRPREIWEYMVNGSLYDPRSHKGVNKRFKCQQCAFAWWSYFGYLQRETGKTIHDLLQTLLAWSVLLDMSSNGGWVHGFWSDEIETHARFHLDGIHLLISQYEKTGEALCLQAAERGMEFVHEHLTEPLDDGSLWFLHDTTEQGDKRRRFRSTILGKSEGNTLCVNTHVQALTVLYRLSHLVPQNETYREMLEKGLKALRRVLEYQPAEALYKFFLFLFMKLRKKARSSFERVVYGVILRSLKETFWIVRCLFPRLVYPGGWIDRDLTISCLSENYQITNLKDFLTLYQQLSPSWLVPYIERNFHFLKKFLIQFGLANALERSAYFIELEDVMYMYDKLIQKVDQEEIKKVQETIFQQTGGHSIDYFASELVRGNCL